MLRPRRHESLRPLRGGARIAARSARAPQEGHALNTLGARAPGSASTSGGPSYLRERARDRLELGTRRHRPRLREPQRRGRPGGPDRGSAPSSRSKGGAACSRRLGRLGLRSSLAKLPCGSSGRALGPGRRAGGQALERKGGACPRRPSARRRGQVGSREATPSRAGPDSSWRGRASGANSDSKWIAPVAAPPRWRWRLAGRPRGGDGDLVMRRLSRRGQAFSARPRAGGGPRPRAEADRSARGAGPRRRRTGGRRRSPERSDGPPDRAAAPEVHSGTPSRAPRPPAPDTRARSRLSGAASDRARPHSGSRRPRTPGCGRPRPALARWSRAPRRDRLAVAAAARRDSAPSHCWRRSRRSRAAPACRCRDGRAPSSGEEPSLAGTLGLTAREREVLRLVAAGRTNREIGAELYISPKTASVHVSRILSRSSRCAIVARRRRSPTGSAWPDPPAQAAADAASPAPPDAPDTDGGARLRDDERETLRPPDGNDRPWPSRTACSCCGDDCVGPGSSPPVPLRSLWPSYGQGPGCIGQMPTL